MQESKDLTDEQLLKRLAEQEPFGVSKVQRSTGWGYNRAARQIEDWLGRSKVVALEGVPWKFKVSDEVKAQL